MKKSATFLSWIGKNTMVIYVLHFWENRIFPISNIYQKLNLSVCRLIDPFIWWICIVMICIVGTYLMGKIGIMRKLFSISQLKVQS